MMKQKGSSAATILLVLSLSCLAMLFGWDYLEASASDVAAVTTLAEPSPSAMATLKGFLAEHPTPTNSELSAIKKTINREIVLEQSRKLTGKPDLQSSSDIAKQSAEAASQNLEEQQITLNAKALTDMTFSELMSWFMFLILRYAPQAIALLFIPIIAIKVYQSSKLPND